MAYVGIYSFPKSGNTWLRSILGTRMSTGKMGVPDLHTHPLLQAEPLNGLRFYKHHGGRPATEIDGMPFETSHFIHIRRNPLDVFLSYLNYLSDNVTGLAPVPFASVDAIAGMPLLDTYFEMFTEEGHLRRLVGITDDYFTHNRSWLDRVAAHPNAVAIRYEDMLRAPGPTLAFLGDWLALPLGEVEAMTQEARRTTKADGRFFWKQQERNYWTYLSEAQVRHFIDRRGVQSAALGYDADYLLAPQQSSGR